MTGTSSRFDGLPKPLRTGLLVLGALAFVFAVKVAPDLFFEDGSRGKAIYIGVVGVLAVLLLVVALRNRRRRLGGADAARSFREALRSGEVPPDADRDAWRAELERAANNTRRAGHFQRFQVARAGVLLVVLLGFAVLADVPTSVRVAFVLLAVAMLAAVLFSRWAARRTVQRVERLRTELG